MSKRRQFLTVGVPCKLPGLDYDGEKLTCGICGKRYRALNVHIFQTHRWPLDEYRETFGLNKLQPLWIPELSIRAGADIRARGWVGKYNRDFSEYHGISHKMSAQGKLAISIGNKGKPRTLTPIRMKAQKANALKGQSPIILTCSLCSIKYYGRKCDKRKNTYCPDCRPKVRYKRRR